ncbi:MAG: DNA polymerase III subunit beta, partial [Planctomycetota bacterium]|nr:DNA polymerase III subunit beta [Planctomycetota bacterium]
MKVLCDREQLREALSLATSVIPVKSTRPAIENVYLAATDQALELVGTDLEVAIRYRIDEVKVEEPGTTLVPARVTADFVRDLSGETLTLETRGESFHIESGADSCELTTVDPDEFPVVARFSDKGALSIEAQTFTRLVNRTGFAAAREQGRYAMHGILTMVEDGVLRMVATDGRRLAVASSPIEMNGESTLKAIVPTKGMQLFCRVIDDPKEEVKIHFGDNQIGLKTARAEIFARLIDGEFPRYSAVIPASAENVIEANTELFAKKLRLVANVTSTDMRAVRLSVTKGQMTIYGRSVSTGVATAHMEVDFKGKPGDIAFNPDYMIEGLKNCESETVR